MKQDRTYFKKAYILYLTGCGLQKTSIRRMKSQVDHFYRWKKSKPVREIGAKDIIRYYDYLQSCVSQYGKPLKPATIESNLGTVKSFFQYLFIQDAILVNPFEKVDITVNVIKEEKKIFTLDEINSFLDGIEPKEADTQRDRAFFELLYSSGLRFKEAVSLEIDAIHCTERMLTIKKGKGNKSRFVPISKTAQRFLVYYMKHGRSETVAKSRETKLVFIGSQGKVSHKMMSSRFKKYLPVHLKNTGFSIHSLRHSCATHLLESGASIRYVQELLGHEAITSTEVYARPGLERIKGVYKTYHPRENDYYQELDDEYVEQIHRLYQKLK